jgi:SpoIID/LytB domain protein
MTPSSPPEALKAQAVAARNELLAKVGVRHLTDPYRLCSTQHCQVYAGAGHEDARSTAAVEATRGEVLIAEADGRPVDTVYSAACGGHTEDNDRAWGGTPDASLRGRFDGKGSGEYFRITNENLEQFLAGPGQPHCARAASFRWHKPIDLATVEKKAAIGRLREILTVERGVSGRVIKLRLTGDAGAKEIAGELEIRRALGDLKSALFVLDGKKDAGGHLVELSARGGGHGHGIGMCQSGAIGLAESGANYRQILLHYYSRAKLKRLY